MVDAGLEIELSTPVWMDNNGDEYKEYKAVGYMISHNSVYLSRDVLCGGCGGRWYKSKGGGHICGKLKVCGKGMEARQEF